MVLITINPKGSNFFFRYFFVDVAFSLCYLSFFLQLFRRLPILMGNSQRAENIFRVNSYEKIRRRLDRMRNINQGMLWFTTDIKKLTLFNSYIILQLNTNAGKSQILKKNSFHIKEIPNFLTPSFLQDCQSYLMTSSELLKFCIPIVGSRCTCGQSD